MSIVDFRRLVRHRDRRTDRRIERLDRRRLGRRCPGSVVWAYERSCQRYTQVREALPAPDPVRFRNREALTEIVNAIVRDELPIDDASIRPLATPLNTPEDTEQLIAMAFARGAPGVKVAGEHARAARAADQAGQLGLVDRIWVGPMEIADPGGVSTSRGDWRPSEESARGRALGRRPRPQRNWLARSPRPDWPLPAFLLSTTLWQRSRWER
jgi:hypothetical protein